MVTPARHFPNCGSLRNVVRVVDHDIRVDLYVTERTYPLKVLLHCCIVIDEDIAPDLVDRPAG